MVRHGVLSARAIVVTLGAVAAWPAIAYAHAHGFDPAHIDAPALPATSPRTGLLRVVIGLSLALALAALAAHPTLRRVERRLGLTVLASSGLPFLALGLFFRHPSVGVLTDDVVADLRPALEFGFGWLGFVVGMQFDLRELDTYPEKTGAVVVVESLLPLISTTLACAAALIGLDPVFSLAGAEHGAIATASHTALRDALALGACAAQAAPVAAVAIARGAGSVAARLVERVTRLDDVAGVAVLGVICAFYRPIDGFSAWQLPHIAWVFVTLGMGGVLGILAYLLIRSTRNMAEEMAYLLGTISLSAGMSGYLAISPMVTCCIAGALLANLPHKETARLRATMAHLERPLYLVFLLVAGAVWDPTAWQGWVLAPVFVFARVGGKLIGAHIAKRIGPDELPDATTLGLALSPQSPIAIVTVVSYVTLYRPQVAVAANLPWLMTACIGGAVLTEACVQAVARMRGGLRFTLPPTGSELSRSIDVHAPVSSSPDRRRDP